MPKSKKKKVKHQDFAKVKLKVGKKLPKAQNETDASFRSQAIQLKDQFRTDGSEAKQPTTKRKLDIGTVLSQCQHYSPSVRQDSVTGLRELLTSAPLLLLQHLSTVLERCSELFLDSAFLVRTSNHKLLKQVILPHIPAKQVTPFFPVLSAYLCCAMTHISEDIQADSLLTFDLLLEFYPELVVAGSSQLLQNFLEQISRQRVGAGKGAGRSLSVNPSGKKGSHKWRVSVLTRLRTLLVAVDRQTAKDSGKESVAMATDGIEMVFGSQEAERGCQVLRGNWEGLPQYCIRRGGSSKSGGPSLVPGAQGGSMQEYTDVIVPLLLESWVEVGPAQLTSSLPGNALNSEALATLSNVLCVLSLLLKVTSTTDLPDSHLGNEISTALMRKKYEADFIKYFMLNFPYAMHERVSHKAGKAGHSAVSIPSLNLAVCELMVYFMDKSDPHLLTQDWFQTVILYICKLLRGCKHSTEQLVTCLAVLRRVLAMPLEQDTQDEILEAVFRVYEHRLAESADISKPLQFFSDLLLGPSSALYQTSTVYVKWVQSFSTLLEKADQKRTSLVLAVLKQALSERNKKFVQEMSRILPKLIVPRFVSSLTDPQQLRLVDILYQCPDIHQAELRLVTELIRQGELRLAGSQYLLRVLSLRFAESSPIRGVGISLGDFVSMTFTLLLGINKQQLIQNSSCGDSKPVYCDFCIIKSQNEELCTRNQHQQLTQVVLAVLDALPCITPDCVAELWTAFLTKLLVEFRVWALETVTFILQASSHLLKAHHCTDQLQLLIGQLLLDTMVTWQISMATHTEEGNVVREMLDSAFNACLQNMKGLLPQLLKLFSIQIQNNPSHVESYVVCLEKLVSWPELQPLLAHDTPALTALLDTILKLQPQLESSSGVASLRYSLQVTKATATTSC